MLNTLEKILTYSFYALAFLVPLVLFPKSSELFEFNKMVLTYALTTVIVAAWLCRMILEKKIVFRRTFLDIPLLLFLISQSFSTIISIDRRTSLLGYYSRFHGGLLSSFSYSLLYWAYVSNMKRAQSLKFIKITLASASLVSIYGILQHFGIDEHIWVQDVRHRVFSTLGQPNWLAAWLTALSPLVWSFALISKLKSQNSDTQTKHLKILPWFILSIIFFITLLYTKSRSGIFAFVISDLIFWATSGFYWLRKRRVSDILSLFLLFNFSFLILIALTGTPWTPSLGQILKSSSLATNDQQPTTVSGPALEVGGTESGQIRKIVWKGALEIWKAYPVLGSGVETFGLSYYKFRPVEHNLVSEWDYLYNKAHNEFLNYAATTGSVGLVAYIVIILFSLLQISNFKLKTSKQSLGSNFKNSKIMSLLGQWRIKNPFGFSTEISPTSHLNIALLSGFLSILVTNFFGFSVVPVALQFFLYPAVAVTLVTSDKLEVTREENTNSAQKVIISSLLLVTFYLLLLIGRYWYADYLYSRGRDYNDIKDYSSARNYLTKAVKYSKNEAIFWDELSLSSSKLAFAASEEGNTNLALSLANSAIAESNKALSLSANNVNIRRDRANVFINLSAINQRYLIDSVNTLKSAVELAPTEAKIWFSLGMAYVRVGDFNNAVETFLKTLELKPNYLDARFALALTYLDIDKKDKAKEELLKILEVSPDNEQVKKILYELEADDGN